MSADRSSIPELAGKLPDAEVAALTDSSVNQVLAYRRAHGILPYVRSPPGSAPAPTMDSIAGSPPVRPTGREDLRDRAQHMDAPMVGMPMLLHEPARKGARRGNAEQRLAPLRGDLGKVSDGEIAERSGLSLGAVGAVRRRLGIPAYSGYLWQTGHKPLGGRGRKPAKHVRGRVDDIEKYAHLVGTVSDAVVAKKAGVSRSLVTAWRAQRGIEAAHPHHNRQVQAARVPREMDRETQAPTVSAALAFTVVALRGDHRESFIVVGADIARAATHALTALAVRRDGPWLIAEMLLLGEAIA